MKIGSLLSIVLFSLVALVHLLRLIFGWEVLVEGEVTPMWVSVLGVLVPASLAVMLWREAR